jgi:hypothetical protein
MSAVDISREAVEQIRRELAKTCVLNYAGHDAYCYLGALRDALDAAEAQVDAALADAQRLAFNVTLAMNDRDRFIAERDALRAELDGWRPSEKFEEAHEILGDMVSLEAEHWALTGGGPNWSVRWNAAMKRAQELFEP